MSKADAVGSKLIWISKGSHKSRRDVRAMVRQASVAERERIRTTAEELGLSALLDEVLRGPDEIVG